MIAALYVQRDGGYYGLPDVDPWDERRDARTYPGPHPVVAHPPCTRWCQLAGLVEARYGHRKGDDGGCFESALASVRCWGGVLEHPAWSAAWTAFDLPNPGSRHGGWQRGICGGWSCSVEQVAYGHAARKATWLYAYGVTELPSLLWGSGQEGTAFIGHNLRGNQKHKRQLGKKEASHTPDSFRAVLMGIARGTEMN